MEPWHGVSTLVHQAIVRCEIWSVVSEVELETETSYTFDVTVDVWTHTDCAHAVLWFEIIDTSLHGSGAVLNLRLDCR